MDFPKASELSWDDKDDRRYVYEAEAQYVVDGDTMDFMLRLKRVVDFGFKIYQRVELFHEIRVRLAAVDTWEMRGENKLKGKDAKEFAIEWLANADRLWVRTKRDKTGKYGRYIAYISKDEDFTETLAAELIEDGHEKQSP